MRNVLKNTDEVFHFWANQTQAAGRAASVFFEGPYIYSYGKHFPIARILPGGAVAFTTRKYSPTTTGHVSAARSAARHLSAVFCHNPEDSAAANMRHAMEEINKALEQAEKKGLREGSRVRLRAQALSMAESANSYLAALPDNERRGVRPIDTASLEFVREQLRALEEAAAQLRKEQLAARMQDIEERLAEWRAGTVSASSSLREIPPALRLSNGGDQVETSHGARIPADDARELWPFIVKVRNSGKDLPIVGAGRQLGDYKLNLIRGDGSIVVGCHAIAYSEIQAIAQALGLSEGARVKP